MVRRFVFEESEKVVVCKSSILQSQSTVEELLKNFMSSSSSEICVLLINMQETIGRVVNHIRVMIEEAELKASSQKVKSSPNETTESFSEEAASTESRFPRKLFVLLLHFPPAQFFQHCYPALFLRSWDHCYLDTIAHSTEEGKVNIEDWFLRSYGLNPSETDTLEAALVQLLPQVVPIVSSRINLGIDSTNVTQCSILNALLFDKEISPDTVSEFGKILCDRFKAYWKPKVMAEYLERAAIFSKQRESTLNITDSIQTQFKALFADFCAYMLTQADKNFNLKKILKSSNEDPNEIKLFFNILKILPVPELHQLKSVLNDNLSTYSRANCPHFPFFYFVYELIEKQVNLSKKTINLQHDLLVHDDQSTLPQSKDPAEELIKAVLSDLGQVSVYKCNRLSHINLNRYIQG